MDIWAVPKGFNQGYIAKICQHWDEKWGRTRSKVSEASRFVILVWSKQSLMLRGILNWDVDGYRMVLLKLTSTKDSPNSENFVRK